MKVDSRPKKNIGTGGVCSVLKKFLHPYKIVRNHEAWKSIELGERVQDLLVIGHEERESGRGRDRKKRMSILFRHDDLPNKVIYCANVRYAHCYVDGGSQNHFNLLPSGAINTSTTASEENVSHDDAEEGSTNPSSEAIDRSISLNEVVGNVDVTDDIQRLRGMGYTVDDDNDPAPENVPDVIDVSAAAAPTTPGTSQPDGLIAEHNQQWGHHTVDQRKVNVRQNVKPFVSGIPGDIKISSGSSKYFMFLLFFGRSIFESLIIPATNASLLGDGLTQVTFGEMLRWIGIWLFLATTAGHKRSDYWSASSPDLEGSSPPYRFSHWMSRNRFDTILRHLSFAPIASKPTFTDKFWKIRKMVQMFNENMSQVFSPGWITCLDESMSIWMSMWTCPGWMVVPRKPHPFGNEWHTICCGISGILFYVEIVEGKDRPPELPNPNANKMGNTVNLLLRMCSTIFGTGRIVILDSGFCVLKGIIELAKKGVYAGAQIKKRRYWPKYVPGDVIDRHFAGAAVGESNGVRGEMEGVPYNIFTLNEADYTSKIMATYGSLEVDESQKKTSRYETLPDGTKKKHEFRYTEPFANHMAHRHHIDDHNNLRHQQPSIEETWKTQTWENRVFAFLLAVTEVNVFKYFIHFVWGGKEKMTLHKFRKELALDLIYNNAIMQELGEDDGGVVKKKLRTSHAKEHLLKTAPANACEFAHGKWKKTPNHDVP